MAASPLQLDVGLTGPALFTGLTPISKRMQYLAGTGGLKALNYIAAKVWCGRSQTSIGDEGTSPGELQEFLWQQFFSDLTQWWDNRRNKPTPRHPDFRHKKSKVALWLDNRHKPAWVDSQLARWDAEKSRPSESLSTSVPAQGAFGRLAAHEAHSEVRMCRKLCEVGRMTDAVDALNLLVQRGFHVPNNLFYCVLKRCIARKDLALGRCIHALTVKSGFEGDAFLATHLIGLYASHRRLEEAMQVFTKIPAPDAYNWSTIIFAYARHGEARQAIRLYRKMRKSTVTPTNHIYVAVLKACATLGDLVAGREIHGHILLSPLKPDIFVQTGLVDMYAKCGSLEDARRVFDRLRDRNVVTWNAMLAGYAQQGMGEEALSLYSSMQQEGITLSDSFTFASAIQACASVGEGALHQGKQLHAQIEHLGLQDDVVLGSSLVNMYAKCGSLENARIVFERLRDRDVVTWTAMIAGYAQQGKGLEALTLYSSMQQEGNTAPNSFTFTCLLQACTSIGVGALCQGKEIHAQIEQRGLQDDVVVGTCLIEMYAKCGSLEEAHSVFYGLPHRNVVTWTAMIAGYAQQGMGQEALSLYSSMKQEGITPPDSVTFVCLLQACASVAALPLGKQLHAQIEERGLQSDAVLSSSLVNMYAKCGSLEDARSVFDRLMDRNVVTLNVMLAGYAQQGMGQEALSLYNSMHQGEGLTHPDSVTFVCLLQACASVGVGAQHQGKQLHAQIEERGLQDDVVLGSSLVNMYAKCSSIDDARSVFDKLPDKNVVTWTTMIAGYAQQRMGHEALTLYSSMQQDITTPDSFTFGCLLQACASVGALHQGKELHARIAQQGLQDDVVVGTCLIEMYAKCGSLEDACRVFDGLPYRNVVTWTTMIAGYVQHGMGQEALSLYSIMQQEGITPPDSVAFVWLLQACAIVAALPLGKQLHAQIQERGLQTNLVVGAALVNMYAKCGSMCDSQQVFDSLPERTIEAWAALTGGYTRHGDSEVVFDLLERMRREGIQPDDITFLHVLTVCSHVGLLDKGRRYFEAMVTDYGISPTVGHYACMIDLLGRAGRLDEALQMAKTMPLPPNGAVWRTLLGACRKWKNVEIGQQAFELAVSMDGKDVASYVLMSNIYASAQMWESAKDMQARRVKCGAWKTPGQSWWTDMGGVVHVFVVGDKNHPESSGIYARPEQLVPKMKKEGYVPHLNSSLRDIPDDEKEAELCGHSEKLAISYALNRTPEGTAM